MLWLVRTPCLYRVPTSLGSLLPLINQLPTKTSNIVDSDAMGYSSSSIASPQVDLPTGEQEYPASSSGSDSDSTSSDSVLDSPLNTPQPPVVGAPLRSALQPFYRCTFHLLHRSQGAQLPLRPCPSLSYEPPAILYTQPT